MPCLERRHLIALDQQFIRRLVRDPQPPPPRLGIKKRIAHIRRAFGHPLLCR